MEFKKKQIVNLLSNLIKFQDEITQKKETVNKKKSNSKVIKIKPQTRNKNQLSPSITSLLNLNLPLADSRLTSIIPNATIGVNTPPFRATAGSSSRGERSPNAHSDTITTRE